MDLYAVSLQAGDEVVADATGSSVLRIFNSTGQQLAVGANAGTPDTQQSFAAGGSGTYFVGVSSPGNLGYDPTTSGSGGGGSGTGPYALDLTLLSAIPISAVESTLNGSPTNLSLAAAQVVTSSTLVHGIYLSGAVEYYSFTAPASGGLAVSVTPADASAFLPRLSLYGAAGQLLIQADSVATGNPLPSATLNQQRQPGNYYLGISAVKNNPSGNQGYVLQNGFSLALPPFEPLPVGENPEGVATGDFNHDGYADIVTADTQSNTVSVLLSRGDGTFQPAVHYSVTNNSDGTGLGPDAVAVGDFAGNGKLDIVTANLHIGRRSRYRHGQQRRQYGVDTPRSR